MNNKFYLEDVRTIKLDQKQFTIIQFGNYTPNDQSVALFCYSTRFLYPTLLKYQTLNLYQRGKNHYHGT
jgi:hypothetical protein